MIDRSINQSINQFHRSAFSAACVNTIPLGLCWLVSTAMYLLSLDYCTAPPFFFILSQWHPSVLDIQSLQQSTVNPFNCSILNQVTNSLKTNAACSSSLPVFVGSVCWCAPLWKPQTMSVCKPCLNQFLCRLLSTDQTGQWPILTAQQVSLLSIGYHTWHPAYDDNEHIIYPIPSIVVTPATIPGYLGDGFTGQKTQPTVSKYWRNKKIHK